jgi:hypothetical protein
VRNSLYSIEMPAKLIEYIPPDIDISDLSFDSHMETAPAKHVSVIYQILLTYLTGLNREEMVSGSAYKRYAFSICEHVLGIPAYSMVYKRR